MRRFGIRFVWVFSVLVLLLGSCHPTGPGTERWVYRLFEQNGYGAGAAGVVFGSDGTAYIAGQSQQTIVVAALNSSGTELWQYRFDTLAVGALMVNCLTLGKDGNLYVAGMHTDYDQGNNRFAVASLTTAGSPRWTYLPTDSSSSYSDGATSVVYGDDGNVYAGGTRHNSFAVTSLTADGQWRWNYQRAGFQDATTSATQLVWGADGNLYAGGVLADTWPTQIGVVSLTPDGGERWVYSHPAFTHWVNGGVSFGQGADGNLYASGDRCWYDGNGHQNNELAVVSLAPDGQRRWAKTCAAANTYYYGSTAGALACGSDGNVYVAFYQQADGGYYYTRFSVLSLDGAGEQNWLYAHNRTVQNSGAPSIVTGGDGNVYCTGNFEANDEFGVLSLTGAGERRWRYRFATGIFGGGSAARAVAWNSGSVCVSGYAGGYNVGQYLLVVSLDATSGAD